MGKSNIQLFVGDVDYLLVEELKRYKLAFSEKFGPENIFEFHPEQFEASKVVNSIFSSGLFVQKKLVIIYGFPKSSDKINKISDTAYEIFEKEFFGYFDSISDDTVIVFVSPGADKRTKTYKELLNRGITVKAFNKSGEKRDFVLAKHVKQRLGERIDDNGIKKLLDFVGDNLYLLKNECEKIKTYCDSKNISHVDETIIEKLAFKNKIYNDFELFKYIFFNKKSVFEFIDNAKNEGVHRNMYMGLILWGIKNILLIIDQYCLGQKNPFQIAKNIGGYPNTIIGMLKIIDLLLEKEEELKNAYKSLVSLESDIKNGIYPENIFWPEIKKILYKL